MLLIVLLVLAGCGAERSRPAAPVDGASLHVMATTTLIADVVRQVGGDRVTVASLLPVGADPHSYTASPQDLRALNDADAIFLNGLGLEGPLLPILEQLDSDAPRIEVNAQVDLAAEIEEAGEEDDHAGEEEHAGEEDHAGEDEHAHAAGDPHTWFDVANVIAWTNTIRDALIQLDPAGAETYTVAADRYTAELTALDQEIRAQVAQLPAERRKLVTDHDEFGYFARAYGFEVIGTVVPSISTLAEPSAQQLAALLDQVRAEGVTAIFISNTVNPGMAQQLAADLGVELVPLYTASLSAADGPASSYPALMRHTTRAIVEALNR
jgi:ABC-type Zn uptake system ZnuABC Zn-binding protein ZnuA